MPDADKRSTAPDPALLSRAAREAAEAQRLVDRANALLVRAGLPVESQPVASRAGLLERIRAIRQRLAGQDAIRDRH